ncbi:hypothetical protein AVEN_220045-1 [Araneus ventricosus]|uniref:Reverse transcriptase domain-containing protein n=1 Tax=Araneus ventricosus TaxID=182803 RepID=A0A4Y2CQ95_ARAVE|nr:hypothetical protein AVEN_220045-1 [Araneus ventricosus]
MPARCMGKAVRANCGLPVQHTERRKRPTAGLLISSYFIPGDNRKVLENLMTQRLTYHLESSNSLNYRQHGFREGKSVDTAINELLSKNQTARRDGKHVLVLCIAINGAFDNLQHRPILKSVDASTCPININRLYHRLLQNRKVTLMTPEGRATKDQKQGCSQGSCSGLALWNIVANEIFNQGCPDNVHIQASADNFVLVIEVYTKNSLVKYTQSATQFSSWCSENELTISTDKTYYILFSKMGREDGEVNIARKDIIIILTDDSKSEHGIGAAFCFLANDIWAYQWSVKLNDNSTVFQIEPTALHEAVILRFSSSKP